MCQCLVFARNRPTLHRTSCQRSPVLGVSWVSVGCKSGQRFQPWPDLHPSLHAIFCRVQTQLDRTVYSTVPDNQCALRLNKIRSNKLLRMTRSTRGHSWMTRSTWGHSFGNALHLNIQLWTWIRSWSLYICSLTYLLHQYLWSEAQVIKEALKHEPFKGIMDPLVWSREIEPELVLFHLVWSSTIDQLLFSLACWNISLGRKRERRKMCFKFGKLCIQLKYISLVKIKYCGEHQWPRGSVLDLRPPGLEFWILCLQGSVTSFISPSPGGSIRPV